MVLVLFNIGWMKYYKGQTRSDRISKGGKYVADHKTGGEVKNFLPEGNFFYGYVRPPGDKINLEKLGAEAGADYVDNVTVVFTATRPEGRNVVVGWYRDAKVWRHGQRHNRRIYFARARRKNCTLLEVDERVLQVPRAGHPDGSFVMGQSNVRYVEESDEAEEFIRQLRRYLEDPFMALDSPVGPDEVPRVSDPDRRVQVEKAAIDSVIKHYKEYTCKSVERENKGWDLEFTRGSVHLLVEVKGCSGHSAKVELTPNEYAAMRRKKPHYRLVIVTNALAKPQLSIVSFNGSDGTWRDQNERKFHVRVMKGARVTYD